MKPSNPVLTDEMRSRIKREMMLREYRSRTGDQSRTTTPTRKPIDPAVAKVFLERSLRFDDTPACDAITANDSNGVQLPTGKDGRLDARQLFIKQQCGNR